MLRRKPLRDAYNEGYAIGQTGAPPDPGRTESYGPEIDWCRLAGWFHGNQEFKSQAKRLHAEALGFDPIVAR